MLPALVNMPGVILDAFSLSGICVCAMRISENPMIAFNGVRNSWFMLAMKRDFASLAASAAMRASTMA